MRRQSTFQNKIPTFYLVATPIGNLQEMTPRAIEVLKQVEVIAAEDTRNTRKLLSHFDIKTKLVTHHRYNQKESAVGLIKYLSAGKDVALVSDAGYPLICDPGSLVVDEVIKAGFNVTVVNGSSALLSGLIGSGLTTQPFYFHGFLPHNSNDAKKQLVDLSHYPMTLVFFEASHRIKRTLSLIFDILGDRKICLARELTKLFEEYFRGNISEILPVLEEVKGEFVLIVEGKPDNEPDIVYSDLQNRVEQYITEGYTASQAIKKVAEQANISKNKLYNYIHQA